MKNILVGASLRRLLQQTLALACLGAIVPPLHAQDSLPDPVLRALAEVGLSAQTMSAIVVPAGSSTARLAWDADTPRSTASTMKLVPTLIGLEELGPTFRWKTELLATTTPQQGKLNGPLYLRGGGDPELTPDNLRHMLTELKDRGVKQINGDLVLDRTFFNPTRTDIGAPDFDEYPRAYYNVIPDALMVNENLLDIHLESDDKALLVRTEPALDGVRIVNRLHLVDMPCRKWDDDTLAAEINPSARNARGRLTITLRGDFPRNCTRNASQNLLERNVYIERLVRATWQTLGGRWHGTVREGTTPALARVLVSHRSRTMAEAAVLVNKPSNNTMARMVYLSLGELRYQGSLPANSPQKAEAVVRDWFMHKGIPTEGMVLENGSGLSRIERLSPRQLAALLEVGRKSNWNAEFAASLPIVGMDGTMRNRLKGTAAQGRARTKTGTLNNTSAIAGYVRDVFDREWIVAGMVINESYGQGVPAINALLQWVAEGAGDPLVRPQP